MHWDQFYVDYAVDTEVPINVQMSGAAATTYMTGYPSYRVLHFNEKTVRSLVALRGEKEFEYDSSISSLTFSLYSRVQELLDVDVYHLNVSELNLEFSKRVRNSSRGLEFLIKQLDANDTSHERWQLAYSFKDYYTMEDLTPASFAFLVQRMWVRDSLLEKYYR